MADLDFKRLVESAPDTIIVFDRDGRYAYVSPAVVEATGGLLTPEKLIGRYPGESGFSDAILPRVLEAQQKARETGQDQVLYLDYEIPSGQRHFQAIVRPQQTGQGQVESLLVIIRDVTDLRRLQEELAAAKAMAEERAEVIRRSNQTLERLYYSVEKRVGERTVELQTEIAVRRQSEERLRESEERYRAIVEDMTEFLSRYTPDGTTTFVNGALCRFYGVSKEILLGKNLYDHLSPEVGSGLRRLLASATPDQPIVPFVLPLRLPGGRKLWQEWTYRVLFDDDGKISGYQGVGRDISAQKRDQEALARREQEFRALADNAPDPIVRYDRNLVRLYANAALSRTLNRPLAEIIGEDLSSVPLSAEVRRAYERSIRGVFETGRESSFTVSENPSLGDRHIQYRLSPEFSKDGRVESVLAIGRDITDMVRLEHELRKAKETAEAASRAKSTFLSNMSHEIRTPLNSIQSVLELLSSLPMGEEAASFVRIAEQSAGHLLRLVNNLLDLSKIEAGHMELARDSFAPRRLLEAIIGPMAVTAHGRGLDLTLDIAEDVPAWLVGDELRLGQILLNLLGNAIKYTDEGRIGVCVRRAEAVEPGAGRVRLLFSVQDTGIGIPGDRSEDVFEGFRHFLDPDRPLRESTGLGLHIAKQIVERMGGRIWVESEPGQGSSFFFTVELEEAEASGHWRQAQARARPAAQLRALRILLVEDNLINQMLTAEILKRRGHDVAMVSDGRQALDALAGDRFDVVLMDVNMPGMDGVETTRHIRAGRAGDPDVPIVAMTAFGLEEDRVRFLQAGMNAHIPKPFIVAELEELLAGIASGVKPA